MIDDTDLDIIEELKKDGRASFSDIADKLGLATSTVTVRFQKLEEKNIVNGFNPEIDYEKLGFELTAMIDIKAEPKKILKTVEKLESRTRVISLFEVTGNTDIIIVSRFLHRKDMNQFLKELQQTEGIKSTETNVILTEPKLEDNMDLKKILKEKRDLS